jgi:2-polyprenyl-6-methoxyphenol hydroxylase-like FAD-dependent oxidoreductase
MENGIVVKFGNGQTFTARHVVGADGSKSVVSNLILSTLHVSLIRRDQIRELAKIPFLEPKIQEGFYLLFSSRCDSEFVRAKFSRTVIELR